MTEKLPTIESSPTTPEKEIILEEVAELEKPIKKIIEKILPRIESGEYGLIIGDDASGRIPTLILGNFIKKISEQKGLNKPNIIFIPGKLEMESESFWGKIFSSKNISASQQQEELDEYISNRGGNKEKKILIVTDTVKYGDSLKTLLSLLKEMGFTCDIATIGVETGKADISGRDRNLQNFEVISGEYKTRDREWYPNTPLIYKDESRKLTGVYKIPGDKVSKTLKSSALPEGIYPEDVNPESIKIDSSRKEIQKAINQAREDVGIVTDRLVNWYESLKDEE